MAAKHIVCGEYKRKKQGKLECYEEEAVGSDKRRKRAI